LYSGQNGKVRFNGGSWYKICNWKIKNARIRVPRIIPIQESFSPSSTIAASYEYYEYERKLSIRIDPHELTDSFYRNLSSIETNHRDLRIEFIFNNIVDDFLTGLLKRYFIGYGYFTCRGSSDLPEYDDVLQFGFNELYRAGATEEMMQDCAIDMEEHFFEDAREKWKREPRYWAYEEFIRREELESFAIPEEFQRREIRNTAINHRDNAWDTRRFDYEALRQRWNDQLSNAHLAGMTMCISAGEIRGDNIGLANLNIAFNTGNIIKPNLKAKKLLLSVLSSKQRKQYKKSNCFTYQDKQKRDWEFHLRYHYPVVCVKPLTQLCIELGQETPTEDILLKAFLEIKGGRGDKMLEVGIPINIQLNPGRLLSIIHDDVEDSERHRARLENFAIDLGINAHRPQLNGVIT